MAGPKERAQSRHIEFVVNEGAAMLFDLVSYPGWLVVALSIGVVVGWRTYSDAPRRNWFGGWIPWGALVVLIGFIVAVLKLLPGRYGLWLEIALMMTTCYIVGCFLGGGLKNLLGAHETGGGVAAGPPDAGSSRAAALAETERQATAKAAADRLAVEVAAKGEAERRAVAAKAEADRLAAEALAKASADRRAAAAKAETDRLAAAAMAETDRRTPAAKAETDGSARKLRSMPRLSDRLLPLPMRRRIVLRRKPLRRAKPNERRLQPSKPRRVVWLQRLPRRSRLGEGLASRPMRRRVVWLPKLPRPRPRWQRRTDPQTQSS